MTDAAVIADSAPVPVETGAAISEGTNITTPLGSQIPPDAVAKPAEPKGPASLDDSIDRAIAKSAAKQAEPKDDPKADVKADPAKEAPIRGENGKFAKDPAKAPAVEAQQPADASKPVEAAKPSHTAEDAPARFTETAKAKWASADPEIRGEVLRMQRELTDGYQKHKAAAERDGALADFHEMAEKSGTTVRDALSRYIGIEDKLRGDLLGGLDEIISNATKGKASLRDVAAHIMGQTPDENASQQEAVIRNLNQKVSQLEQQLGCVTQTIQRQHETATLTEINKFASDNPRFEELADDIAFFMKPQPVLNERGEVVRIDPPRTKDLSEAYKLAERLNPAPQSAPLAPAASSAAPDLSVQPDKGQKSINGAPSAGFTSQRKKGGPIPSLDEALDRAFG